MTALRVWRHDNRGDARPWSSPITPPRAEGIGHIFQTDEIYKMWEELLQITDAKARDAQLRKIGNYKFENFETIPLFDVFIEVIVDPKIVADWPFPGWDGGDVGHTWRIMACKQEKPCK
jgi:hypothetical protein